MDRPLRYLPFHAERAQVQTDAEAHAATYALVAPLIDFTARAGHAFAAEWVGVRSGAVTIIAGTSTPVLSELSAAGDQATLHLPVFGEGRYRLEDRLLISRAGETAVYLPGAPHRSETTRCAGLSIGLDPRRLAAAAARLAGEPEAAERYLSAFQQPLQFEQSDKLVCHLLDHLRRVIALIDLAPGRSFDLAPCLALDRMIEQALALLLYPALLQR